MANKPMGIQHSLSDNQLEALWERAKAFARQTAEETWPDAPKWEREHKAYRIALEEFSRMTAH